MTSSTRQNAARETPGPRAASELYDPVWQQTTVKRAGAPPLRFKGRELARNHAGEGASITLWERKGRGFVAAVDDGIGIDSHSADTLEGAMAWLEGYCDTSGAAPGKHSVEAFLNRLPAEIAAARRIRILAGQALDHWDRLTDPELGRGPMRKDKR